MENYHIFSMIRMGFILKKKKNMCSTYFKKKCSGKGMDVCLKIRFLALVQ